MPRLRSLDEINSSSTVGFLVSLFALRRIQDDEDTWSMLHAMEWDAITAIILRLYAYGLIEIERLRVNEAVQNRRC